MYLKNDHTYSAVELFKTFNTDRIKGKGKIARKYKCRDKKALAQKIFMRYLYLLLNDMVNGGKIFYFPTKHLSCLKMVRISGDKFKDLRKKGFFKNVDFITSNFSGYFLAMEYYNTRGKRITKYVTMSDNLSSIITQKTNEGYRYC